jgi:hypothetical protein
MFVDTHDAKFRMRFMDAVKKREEELQAAFKRTGVDVLSLSTGDDLVKAIIGFAKQRQQVKTKV